MAEHDNNYVRGGNVTPHVSPRFAKIFFLTVFIFNLLLLTGGELCIWLVKLTPTLWVFAFILLLCSGVIISLTGWVLQGKPLAVVLAFLVLASVFARVLLIR